MNTLTLLKAADTKAVFAVSDVQRLVSSKKYAKLVLHRLKKKGLIRRVTQNLYTTKNDINVIASHITTPAYISFWSASSFLGYTEQVLNTVQVATTRKVKAAFFNNYLITCLPLKEFYGYKKIRTNAGELFIVEPEKLLIDCFLRHKAVGNFDEIIKIFEKAEISEEKVVEYLKRAQNQSLTKRVGYLLEKIRNIDISLHFTLDTNYILLNPFSKKQATNNTKWRVKI